MGFIRTFLIHHLPWVILVVVGLLGIQYWEAERDARLQADAKIKVDETQVQTLQQAITQKNRQIRIALASRKGEGAFCRRYTQAPSQFDHVFSPACKIAFRDTLHCCSPLPRERFNFPRC